MCSAPGTISANDRRHAQHRAGVRGGILGEVGTPGRLLGVDVDGAEIRLRTHLTGTRGDHGLDQPVEFLDRFERGALIEQHSVPSDLAEWNAFWGPGFERAPDVPGASA